MRKYDTDSILRDRDYGIDRSILPYPPNLGRFILPEIVHVNSNALVNSNREERGTNLVPFDVSNFYLKGEYGRD